jgi:hypothetical protein
MPKVRRPIKLIRPRLQLKLILASMGICLLGLLFECLFFAACLAELAIELPQDGPLLLENLRPLLVKVVMVSCMGILPLVFIVGVLTTFRVAGPLYRIEMFLKQVARGEKPADCRLRKGDELVEFCEVVNLATAPLRRTETEGGTNVNADPGLHEAA